MCTFQSLWVDTSNFAFPFLCISWQRCWNTLQRAPLPIRPCACKCVCVCVCICHVTDSYDGCAANPGLINYTPSGCHMSHWWNTYMESQSPTRTHWADVHICMRVCVCLVSCMLPTACWKKVTMFYSSKWFKLPPFIFKSDFRSVHLPSWCWHITDSHSREDNHKNVYFLCQQFIKMCENV